MTRWLASLGRLGNHREVPARIYSVGYEGLEVRGLIEHFSSAGVELVVDVRLNPVSRKPGRSKRSLKAELESAGIEYQHEPSLGNPPDNRISFRPGNGEEGRQRMREIVANGSSAALQRLVDESIDRRVAVLCASSAAQPSAIAKSSLTWPRGSIPASRLSRSFEFLDGCRASRVSDSGIGEGE